MGSNRDTSNGPAWRDIATAIHAFQVEDKCVVGIYMSCALSARGLELHLLATAAQYNRETLEVQHLASASVKCADTGPRTLEGAVFQLLYALDFKLATNAATRVLDNQGEAPAAPR